MPYDRITQAAIDLLTKGDTVGRSPLRAAIEAKHPGALARATERVKRERVERKFKGNPPAWVKRLVMKHEPTLRELRWHRSQYAFHGECQMGRWAGNEISVTVPRDLPPEREDEAKVLVLHELAHAAAIYGAGHGDDFYDEWARLLKAEGLYRRALVLYRGKRAGSLRAAARRLREQAARKAARAAGSAR